MANCEAYWELMSGALDGALTEEERRRLEEHLVRCPECRELFAQMQNMSADMPGVEPAPAGFADGVMAGVADLPQDIPFTNLPQNRDIHKESREQLKVWWKPIKRWGAAAACFLLILGVGAMVSRSGMFSMDSSNTGAAPPGATVHNQESQAVADDSMSAGGDELAMDTKEEVSADTVYSDSTAEDTILSVAVIEWDGVRYAPTGDVSRELPEGFSYAGEFVPDPADQQDVFWEIYTGTDGEIYVRTDAGYEFWVVIDA